eukprot:scaffold25275_cov60-Cyclotella_meneghiniana.AAC.5
MTDDSKLPANSSPYYPASGEAASGFGSSPFAASNQGAATGFERFAGFNEAALVAASNQETTGFERFAGFNEAALVAASNQETTGFERFAGFNEAALIAASNQEASGFEGIAGFNEAASGTPVKDLVLNSTTLSNGEVVFKDLKRVRLAHEQQELFAQAYAESKYQTVDAMKKIAKAVGWSYLQVQNKFKKMRMVDPELDETKNYRGMNLTKLEALWKTTQYPTIEQYAEVKASQVGPEDSHYEVVTWFKSKRFANRKAAKAEAAKAEAAKAEAATAEVPKRASKKAKPSDVENDTAVVRQSKRTAKSKVNYYESASDAEDDESEASEN